MPEPVPLVNLDFTVLFLRDYASRDFSSADRRAIERALERLDQDERHPSLRVHQLAGQLAGVWSASASQSLRITFIRVEGGRKLIVECSKHYDR